MASIVPVTVSPTIGTPTHNTSGYDEIIFVSGQSPNDTNTSARTITALCDASATPTTQVATNPIFPHNGAVASTTYGTVCFVVPAGFYWTITGTLSAISSAVAWQLQGGSVAIVDATASRALATNYLNSTGNAILLLPQLATTSDVKIYHDSFSPPTNAVWRKSGIGSASTPWAIIPNGDYYQVASTGATITKWLEVQLPLQATRSDLTASRTPGTVYQNTTTEALWEVPTTHDIQGLLGSRYRHALYNDTVNPPVQIETVFSDSNSGEVETMPGFVGVNYYFKEDAPDGGTEILDKWWEYSFVPRRFGKPVLMFANP